jgi:protein TonB
MTDATLANLAAYSVQVAIVIGGGAALPLMLRLRAPGVGYAYWRALAFVCLLLPWVQPYHAAPQAAPSLTAAALSAPPPVEAGGARAVTAGANRPAILALVLIAGAALRLMWIGVGLAHLRRLRKAGHAAAPCGDDDRLQRIVGARAEIREVVGLAHPVTFGVWRPVVLLPASLGSQPSDIRQAVVAHELFHVQRRDWAWVLIEEAVRAVFWFHPAVWWLISRIRLAREEVVDELTVLLTNQRKRYIEALLTFADDLPFTAVPAFARRRHLLRRVMLISKEGVMTSRRVVASCVVMAIGVAAGGWYAVAAFPMTAAQTGSSSQSAPGPLERGAQPITPENPIPRRLASMAPAYPPEAAAAGARGSVTMRITVDDSGVVREARPVGLSFRSNDWQVEFIGGDLAAKVNRLASDSGLTPLNATMDAFIASAVEAVRQWRYDPPFSPPISFDVKIDFAAEGSTSDARDAAGGGAGRSFSDGALRLGGKIRPPKKIKDVKPVYPAAAEAAKVYGVVILEARIEPDGRVSQARVLRGLPLLDEAALDAVRQWIFTPTLLNNQPVPVLMTVTVAFRPR